MAKKSTSRALKSACEVIFDGIDLNIYKLDNTVAVKENVITYGNKASGSDACLPAVYFSSSRNSE